MRTVRRRRWVAPVLALGILLPSGASALSIGAYAAAPTDTRLLADGECQYPSKPLEAKPWSLQRVLLDELWQKSTGKGVTVAVIDSGVDKENPQLGPALTIGGKDYFNPAGQGTDDTNGHGTMAAGIIAARPGERLTPKLDTGFVGIAPDALILPIRQNGGDEATKGNELTLADAINFAVNLPDIHVGVINISQDTEGDRAPGGELREAVRHAIEDKGVVVVAAAGNSGDKENRDTWPASYPGVLAVGASDRNNERAPFSQNKPYVGVMAPGVDMWSTVPKGGHCLGNGTSFSAPYVAGVVALIRAQHPSYTPAQVVTLIEQTAQRAAPGSLPGVGWGVVDPLRALNTSTVPGKAPVPDPVVDRSTEVVHVEPLSYGPTRAEKDRRKASVVLFLALGVTVMVICGAVVIRDARKRGTAS
ncbi:type VII secretion-associated serine protease mycosin [Streptomyces sp. SID3343]|uniref:type VII secretion-associated serine protease mycosin n=1 Tax=Streptomyces sp. SID3343 TaxID=2690260 RepID=UPI00136E8419|nr:type VII secretion-associated serine protease mycosin [Streptomyces sp. SID3343]MYW00194.1 type VII secretion-associated serine protease mycosin [Streptomyces sp. SID3343]